MQGLRKQNQGSGSSVHILKRVTGASALAAMLVLAGCRQDMHDQPKFFPQRGTDFFADGRSARPQVDNTVARGQMHDDAYFYTGMQNGGEGNTFPFPVTLAVLQRGQERFNVYCTPCHSRVGNGQGMIVQRGYMPAATYHSERLRNAPLGHFFNVMTNGYGAMPDYAAQLTPADRWAVVAYIKALQLSQNATQSDIAPGAHPETLSAIAEREGMPASFAGEWEMPRTATSMAGLDDRPVPTTAAPTPPPTAPSATPTATPAPATAKPVPGAAAAPAAGKAPAVATTPAKPAASSAADIAAGKEIYQRNCQVCHQPTLQGMPPMIPALIGVVQRTSAAHVRSNVTNGVPTAKPPMPSFAAKLSSEDIDHLIAFLSSTGSAEKKP